MTKEIEEALKHADESVYGGVSMSKDLRTLAAAYRDALAARTQEPADGK